MAPTPSPKLRFAILDCEDAVKWDGHAIALSRLLGKNGETWEHHRVWSGELPDLREIETYQGLGVTGSHYSTMDEDSQAWIGILKRFLAKVVVHGGVKIYSACFGAQVLAEALGGKVDKNICGEFVLTRETVTVTDAMKTRGDYCESIEKIPPSSLGQGVKKSAEHKLSMIQSHGDCVVTLPNGAVLLASSPTAPNEMWSLGEDVLAVQGHPELDGKAALTKILPHVRTLSEESKASAKSSLRLDVDHITIIGMIRGFLRGVDGLAPGDNNDTVNKHVEAARQVLSDTATPRALSAPSTSVDVTSDVDGAAVVLGAAAAAGAASVGGSAGAMSPKAMCTGNTSCLGRQTSGSDEPSKNPRDAQRDLLVAAEETFGAVAHAAKDEIRIVSEEFAVLGKLNAHASEKYKELGETVAGLGVFADSLKRKDEKTAPLFVELDVVELNLDVLEQTADILEAEADRLELRAKEVNALVARKQKEREANEARH